MSNCRSPRLGTKLHVQNYVLKCEKLKTYTSRSIFLRSSIIWKITETRIQASIHDIDYRTSIVRVSSYVLTVYFIYIGR